MVAQQSLNLFVMVRIHVGQPLTGTEIFEILLASFRADFRAVIEIKAQEIKAQENKAQETTAQEIDTRVAECFFFGISLFGSSIPREKANIPREKANIPREKFNDPEPLRLKGPRTLRRV